MNLMNFEEPELRILTDDCDLNNNELCIQRGGNGDIYVSIGPQGFRHSPHCVRLATSGGVITQHRDLILALAKALTTSAERA